MTSVAGSGRQEQDGGADRRRGGPSASWNAPAAPLEPGSVALIQRAARLAAAVTVAAGLAIATLAAPSLTSFGLVLAGVGLWLAVRPASGARTGMLVRALGAVVAASGALSALRAGGAAPAGLATGSVLVLVGAALMTIDRAVDRRGRQPAEWLAVVAALAAFLGLLAYAYGAGSSRAGAATLRAVICARAGLLAVALGILFARPDRGLMGVANSATPGGVLARRMLPAAVLLPVATGWLRLRGQHAGLYGVEMGVALHATATVVCFSAFVVWTARALLRADAARREVEQTLRAREEHLRITLNSIGDGVISTDSSGRVVDMNPAAEKLTGWRVVEARQQPVETVFRVINEDTRLPFENPVARVLRQGTAAGLATHSALVARDGKELSIADCGAPIRDAGGNPHGVVVIFRDMTESRRTERALRRGESLFSRLSSAGIIGILVADLDGKVIDANDAVLRTLGYAPEEIVSGAVDLARLTPPEWSAADQNALGDLMTAGVSAPREKEYIRKDGTRVPVLVGVAMLDELTSIAFVLDLTERKRAEEARARLMVEAAEQRADRERIEQSLRDTEHQMRQLQRLEAVGRLAGGVAHDFNNLLSVILGHSEVLLAELPEPDPMREEIVEIRKAGQRAAALTRQLLAFSRRQMLEPRVVDLNEIVQGISNMLGRLIGEDVELAFHPAIDLGRVFVDPGQIEQILMNLVVNARDAMPKGGRVTIETCNVELEPEYAATHVGVKPGPHVMLGVTDTGTGIDPAIRDRIFEPFFTTKEKGKGTGLGLSTVYGIVKQSGGNIWVYSELGAGTTFKLYFPRCEAPALTTVESVDSGARNRVPAGATILLVEDEEQLRRLTSGVLRRAGFHVLEARNGAEALEIARQHQATIHLLLTDVVMPELSGPELARRFEALRPDAKVLFMSGYTGDAIVQHGVLNPGVAFVQKPIMPEALLRKIGEVLEASG